MLRSFTCTPNQFELDVDVQHFKAEKLGESIVDFESNKVRVEIKRGKKRAVTNWQLVDEANPTEARFGQRVRQKVTLYQDSQAKWDPKYYDFHVVMINPKVGQKTLASASLDICTLAVLKDSTVRVVEMSMNQCKTPGTLKVIITCKHKGAGKAANNPVKSSASDAASDAEFEVQETKKPNKEALEVVEEAVDDDAKAPEQGEVEQGEVKPSEPEPEPTPEKEAPGTPEPVNKADPATEPTPEPPQETPAKSSHKHAMVEKAPEECEEDAPEDAPPKKIMRVQKEPEELPNHPDATPLDPVSPPPGSFLGFAKESPPPGDSRPTPSADTTPPVKSQPAPVIAAPPTPPADLPPTPDAKPTTLTPPVGIVIGSSGSAAQTTTGKVQSAKAGTSKATGGGSPVILGLGIIVAGAFIFKKLNGGQSSKASASIKTDNSMTTGKRDLKFGIPKTKAADMDSADAKNAADKKAADEKRAADKKAADESKAAKEAANEVKKSSEKAVSDSKMASDSQAAKKEAEKAAAEAKKIADKKAADEKKAAEQAVKEAKKQAQQAAAEAKKAADKQIADDKKIARESAAAEAKKAAELAKETAAGQHSAGAKLVVRHIERSPCALEHVVHRGDTIWSVGQAYNVDPEEIVGRKENKTIWMPGMSHALVRGGFDVQEGESLCIR
mmetsp:Transcript_18402/g.35006  ORF Transcript_18402/g.35006 Transcript_18402/m.35006 type:complete len:671 (-) Transcript_18402:408-2420(-)|eukprot:CAMPEP_0114310142 /NCGR_PEP_ID=MMETSP0059-20121206/19074_1 /TAXON_ID=36894 /ORGANISM="Pyramimonas parkeae, Strain CCMP726" /LENGTH=670 /DNA_ID=CAMNT_0001434111 /DNA_START=43 /DNA_END=2055 /DNA_ORIENTATION=-